MEHAETVRRVGEPCPLPTIATVDPDILDQIPAQVLPWQGDADGHEPNIVRGLD